MSAYEKIDLTNAIQGMLTESIYTCPAEDKDWYKDCTMEDYFTP